MKKILAKVTALAMAACLTLGLAGCGVGETGGNGGNGGNGGSGGNGGNGGNGGTTEVKGEKLPEENFEQLWRAAFDIENSEQFDNCKITIQATIAAPTAYGWTNRAGYTLIRVFADGLEYGKYSQKSGNQLFEDEYFFDGEEYYVREIGEEWENTPSCNALGMGDDLLERIDRLDPNDFTFDAQKGEYSCVDEFGQTWSCKFKNQRIIGFTIYYKEKSSENGGNSETTVTATFTYGGQKLALPEELEKLPLVAFDTTKPVTISFSHVMGQNLRTVLRPYAEEFMALYPNITITNLDEPRDSSIYDELYSMISMQIIVGTEPNIAYCYPDHVAGYNAAGAVQTLDDFLPGGRYADMEVTRADGTTEKLGLTEEQVDMFVPGYYNEGRSFGDGKMYTMPFSKSTEVLFYNETEFKKNGWKVPTTWEEMEETCRAIKKQYPESIPLGYDSEENWFITMCEQYGSPYTSATGDHYLFDNKQNREFVEYFADWYQDGLVTTQALNNDTYTSNLFTQKEPDGKAYMCIASTVGASYQQSGSAQGQFDFTVGIARIPQVDPADPKVISQGPSVCIFKKGDVQQVLASWLFIKYLITNVDFQAKFSIASGNAPVLRSP